MKKIILNVILPALSLLAISMNAQALELGQEAPCLVLTGLEANGTEAERCIREPQTGQEEKRYTIIKFFSVHCSACEDLHKLWTNHLKQHSHWSLLNNAAINYLGIDRQESLLRRYAEKKATDLNILNATTFIDSDRDAKDTYNVKATPTIFVLDRREDFKVIYKHIGSMNSDQFAELLTTLSDKACPSC